MEHLINKLIMDLNKSEQAFTTEIQTAINNRSAAFTLAISELQTAFKQIMDIVNGQTVLNSNGATGPNPDSKGTND